MASPLYITQLSIHKMPGFPKGLRSYTDLSKGINLIAGPNASGKSSTARVIQQMLGDNKPKGLHAEIWLDIEGDQWWIEKEEGRVRSQRNGAEEPFRGAPSEEVSKRYMLAFHELIADNETELATKIAQEAIGGYDLDSAKDDFEYKDHIKKSGTEFTQYQDKKRKREKLQKKQEELQRKQDRLVELEEEKKEKEKAQQLQDLNQIAKEHKEAEKEYLNKKEVLDAFPDIMENVHKGDYETVKELEEEINQAEKVIEKAKKEKEKDESELESLTLPESGIPEEVLDELDQRTKNLERIQEEIGRLEEERIKASTKARKALEQIGEGIDPDQWKGLTLENISDLDRFLEEAHRIKSQEQHLKIEKVKLEKELENKGQYSSDDIKDGIKALSAWLRESRSHKGVSTKWILGIAGIGVASSILTVFLGWEGVFIGVILLLGITGIALSLKASKNEEKSVREGDYEKTRLSSPEQWSTDQVSEKLNELQHELEKSHHLEEVEKRIQTIEEELQNLNPELERIQKEYEEKKQRIQALPGLPEEKLNSYSELAYFIHYIKEWHEANTEAETLVENKREKENKEFPQKLEKVNKRFDEFYYSRAYSFEEVEGLKKKMRSDEERRESLKENIKQAEEKEEEKTKEKEQKEGKLKKIYERLNLDYGQIEKVKELEEKLEAYDQAKQNVEVQKKSEKQIKEKLEEHSLFQEEKGNFQEMMPDQLAQQVQQYQEEASKIKSVNEEISNINAEIKQAMEGNVVEEALAEEEQALDGLEELYEGNMYSVAGALLVEGLKAESQENDRPKVLERSSNIFSRITNGAYMLQLEGKENEFRAFDNKRQIAQRLNELSSGTRIQLLFSVRLAFIETHEDAAYKLPLLGDELMGNSDDLRAQAIIDALTQINEEEGRQVFYFTAQADEVAKWRKNKEEKEEKVEITEHLLEGKDNEEIPKNNPPYLDSISLWDEEVPSPDGRSYREYGDILEVPVFDLMAEKPEQLHLWYLIEDPSLLAKCLRKRITTWGQLKAFMESKGKIEGLDRDFLKEAEEKITLLDRYQKLYQQGRPRSIDSAVLEDSGAVSGKFLNEVSDKLKEHSGNPEKLLESLKNGEVKRFSKNKIEELENYLFDNDFLSEERAMDKEMIIAELQSFISNLELSEKEAEDFLNKF